MSEDRIVVVGVDGSAGSAVALRWALDHADQLGEIEPVMTFVSGPFEYGFDSADGPDGPGQPYRSDAILRLRAFLEAHAPALVDNGVVTEYQAGPGLVKAARSAELLVVGMVRAYTDDAIAGERLAPSTPHAETVARTELDREVAAALRDLPERHAAVDVVVRPGDPRAVLRTMCDGADVLVVGARGHGVLDHMLLGSVASALAHHPTVPTIVVPHRAARTPDR